jgi:hypothetical protein
LVLHHQDIKTNPIKTQRKFLMKFIISQLTIVYSWETSSQFRAKNKPSQFVDPQHGKTKGNKDVMTLTIDSFFLLPRPQKEQNQNGRCVAYTYRKLYTTGRRLYKTRLLLTPVASRDRLVKLAQS